MNVIPAYDQLQQDFKVMEDDTMLPSICRVAAHAAFLMTQKYYSRLDECEAYFVVISKYYPYILQSWHPLTKCL